jgi:hypothetical protein
METDPLCPVQNYLTVEIVQELDIRIILRVNTVHPVFKKVKRPSFGSTTPRFLNLQN